MFFKLLKSSNCFLNAYMHKNINHKWTNGNTKIKNRKEKYSEMENFKLYKLKINQYVYVKYLSFQDKPYKIYIFFSIIYL